MVHGGLKRLKVIWLRLKVSLKIVITIYVRFMHNKLSKNPSKDYCDYLVRYPGAITVLTS